MDFQRENAGRNNRPSERQSDTFEEKMFLQMKKKQSSLDNREPSSDEILINHNPKPDDFNIETTICEDQQAIKQEPKQQSSPLAKQSDTITRETQETKNEESFEFERILPNGRQNRGESNASRNSEQISVDQSFTTDF